ncbi:MAG: hypothetical protein GXX93_11080 [Anaerolineae bacterium]|nr:hypothetical protein [Anaerolineae bacterium]
MEPAVDRLRRTLRSLGEPRLAPAEEPVQKRPPELGRLADLAGGEIVVEAERTGYLAVRHVYPVEHRHGHAPLSLALEARPETLGLLARDARLDSMDPSSAVYFDTETTGLGTATGTLVFLVGVGRFVTGGFEVTQYFLPGPDGEKAFLGGVREGLGETFLVSYNGKCFDAPLLQTRYLLQRERLALTRWPHLDLLRAARGLYRARVPDCRLGTIERMVLGVEREEADVPGFLIPGIYFDYLRSGAVEELARVFYHNLLDVLSLAGLGGAAAATMEGRLASPPASDLSGAGRLLELAGRDAEAEASYRRALLTARGEERAAMLRRLGFLLKRQREHVRAAEVWNALVESGTDRDGVAHTELAKHLEHRIRDYTEALAVVEMALQSGAHRAPGMRAALEHRKARLLAKQASRLTGPRPD